VTARRDSALRFVRDRLRARWPWLLAVALPSLFALVWLLRGPLAERLWPEAEAERLRQQAEVALAQGRLTADDGSGARELYEAAVAIDPDRAALRAGLSRVAQAAVRQARTAVDAGRFEEAHRALRLARALSAPRAQTDAVAERLRAREAAVAGIDTLLQAADAARVAGRLVGDDAAALPLYRRILALQPQHLRALEGREDALTLVLQQAREAIARGDPARAAAEIALARAYDAGHADLPEAQAALAQSVERLRRRADADLRAGRLARAADGYRAWRDSGVDTADAETALLAVARAHAARSRKAAADFDFEPARRELAAAQALAPDAPESIAAREALSRAERVRSDAGPKPLTPAAERRLRRWLLEAAAAEARGDWLTPPGDSAFDKLRAARALSPDDAGVRRASARMLPRVRECFEQELRDNRLQRARVCLDARLALEGGSRDADRARQRLAQRWVAVGEERLGSGDVEGARAAHDAARGLDAKAEGLPALTERLRAVVPVER
jgi:hypothetical protein